MNKIAMTMTGVFMLTLAAGPVGAAVLTWDPVYTATGNPLDVVTDGVFVSGSGITVQTDSASPSLRGSPPGGRDTTYRDILRVGASKHTTSSDGTITLRGLTLGLQYLVQIWTPSWNNQYPTTFTAGNTSGEATTGFGSQMSQHVIGRFTADPTTQQIT